LNHQKKEEPWKQKTPRGNRGTVSELLVCSDLLIRGYYVFRNISPHGPCDLVALKSEKLIRVEVKGSYERKDGTFRPSGVAQQIGKDYDVLAYTYMGKVSYEPEIE
jgi:Holliday junction resolvase-like predicted endonuclease